MSTCVSVTEMKVNRRFLGLVETRVKLMPVQSKLEGDRAVLDLTGEQAKGLQQYRIGRSLSGVRTEPSSQGIRNLSSVYTLVSLSVGSLDDNV